MRRFLLILLPFIPFCSVAQSTGDFMVGLSADAVKTDIFDPFQKVQAGLELNYFVKRNFSATLGADIWSQGDDSFAVGMRWYFVDVSSHSHGNYYFLRLRGLIGVNDVAAGLGWARAINANLRLEVLGDYYFQNEFALRAGVAYILK